MKKLKPWQIVLLIIFYPVGIVYLIVWLVKKNGKNAASAASIDPSKLSVLRDFHTKVVGVTYENEDGTSRQEILKTCVSGEDILLKPVAVPNHPEAVGVFRKNGQQLGFLNSELAARMRNEYAHNPMAVRIAGLTGGGGYARGCNLNIVIYALPDGAGQS